MYVHTCIMLHTYMCTSTQNTQMCAYVCVKVHGYTLESKNDFLKWWISLSLFISCNSMLTAVDANGFVPQERRAIVSMLYPTLSTHINWNRFI